MKRSEIPHIVRAVGTVMRPILASIKARIDSIETQLRDIPAAGAIGPQGPKGEDGKSPDVEKILLDVMMRMQPLIQSDRKSFREELVPQLLATIEAATASTREKLTETILRSIAEIQKPKDGERGPAGPHGERGEAGPRGERGEKGDPGPIGATGPQGPEGKPGQAGDRGLQGEPGPAGAIGIQGPRGDAGLQGERGPAGERGERGERGAPGEKGDSGPIGPHGPRGDAGIPGERGGDGKDGRDGRDGIAAEIATRDLEILVTSFCNGFADENP